jgi:transposase
MSTAAVPSKEPKWPAVHSYKDSQRWYAAGLDGSQVHVVITQFTHTLLRMCRAVSAFPAEQRSKRWLKLIQDIQGVELQQSTY